MLSVVNTVLTDNIPGNEQLSVNNTLNMDSDNLIDYIRT